MIGRRGFLARILAAAAAPAFVKSTSLMPLWVPRDEIVLPEWLIGMDFGARDSYSIGYVFSENRPIDTVELKRLEQAWRPFELSLVQVPRSMW